MPRRCTVCDHPETHSIDETLVSGAPYRSVAKRFELSESAVYRHKTEQLPAHLLKAREAEDVAQADELLEQVRTLQGHALDILERAEKAGDLRTALAAISQARGNLELLAKLILRNIADGSTLYAEAKRLNDLGMPGVGHRYGSKERVPGRRWATTTIRGIVRQRAYSGTHEVRIGGDVIQREVPAIVSLELQERARAALADNRRAPRRKDARRYLLAGLVRCATCGYGCSGHATWGKGKRYSYYSCITNKPGRVVETPPHGAPYVRPSGSKRPCGPM
jgi:hypothetical protein